MKNSMMKLVLSLLIFATAGLVPQTSTAGPKKKTLEYYLNFTCTIYKVKKKRKVPFQDDAMSWVKNDARFRPCYAPVKEDGKTFALRVLIQHYKPNSLSDSRLKTGSTTEHSKIKKWADKNFEDPK